ncbi:MAG TPA: cyclic nucleotide-binding domain-containing protein [Mariprofundaceae bacterium]|nr:cyclic nucleotide-binding domain-containing protein [Mariprofundaceae bacterium]
MEIDFEWLKNELRLKSMSEQERQAIEEAIEPMFVLPGIPIINQGTEGSSLYLLRSGNVTITRMINGHETQLSSGDYSKVFGEISMFSNEPVNASVIARQACVVYKISCEHFQRLMQENSELALKLLTFIVRNMGRVIRRLDTQKSYRAH